MCEQIKTCIPLHERMKFITYSTLYSNILNRLQWHEEIVDGDFFTKVHKGDAEFLQHYQKHPTIYHCNSRIGYIGNPSYKSTYLVVGGVDRVVLLLSPEEAHLRNLPYLSVHDGQFFRPQLVSPIDYWQKHIEPVSQKVENVLFGQQRPSTNSHLVF
jgi:hypothetical protein